MTVEDFECMTETTVTYADTGMPIRIMLDWDENRFYVMLEQTMTEDEAIEWDEDYPSGDGGMHDVWTRTEAEIARIGIRSFFDLDDVNRFVASIDVDAGGCSAGGFYEDEFGIGGV